MSPHENHIPRLVGAVLFGGSSRFYVSLENARRLISDGCILCHASFAETYEVLDICYETSDLYVTGMPLTEVAQLRLALIPKTPTVTVLSGTVYILDKKAAVCQSCFTDYLKQIVALNERSQ